MFQRSGRSEEGEEGGVRANGAAERRLGEQHGAEVIFLLTKFSLL